MLENRVHALAEFLKIVPETISIKGRKYRDKFKITDSGERISGSIRDHSGELLDLRFDFDPNIFTIVDAFCSCRTVKPGAICEHICGLAGQLVEDHANLEESAQSLEFLDKHLNSPAYQNAQFQLSIGLTEVNGFLEPEIKVHKFIKEGVFGAGRRFTSNDSYKLIQGDPADQGLLDFIRNFRQILFYSNYEPPQRFSWGFWLSLLDHPRVSFKNKPLAVHSAPAWLNLVQSGEHYLLKLDHSLELSDEVHYFEVDGGMLGLCAKTRQLLVCQVDKFRLGLLMEAHQIQPRLTRAQLLTNLHRLEKLRKYFKIALPEDLSEVIQRVPPSLILLLDLQVSIGFSLSPRIAYEGTEPRLSPGTGGQYLTSTANRVIERDFAAEQDLLEDFLNQFPYEEQADKNYDYRVDDLERALVLIEWLKAQNSWHLEWLREEPKIHQVKQVQGLRVHLDAKAWLKIHLMADDKVFSISYFPDDDQFLAGTRFVAVGEGEWVEIDQHLRQRLNNFKMAVTQEKRTMKLKKAALALLAEMEDVIWEGDRGWLDKIDEWRGLKEDKYSPDKNLNATLRNYQTDGYRWLRRMSELGVGACLADDMGLGKTVQALAVVLDRLDKGPILVVAPASVGFNWKEEIEKFAPSLNPLLYSEGRRAKRLSKLKKKDILIISYALVLKDIEKLGEVSWGTLILDEAQFVKNALSQTAIAVSKLKRDWTLALTGTPLENHLGELWSIFRMLNPELLGSWDHFRRHYSNPIEKNHDQEKMQALRQLIRPFILRRTKQKVLADLPERSDIILKVELPEAQRTKYEAERGRILAQLDESDETVRFKLLAAITRLRQLACHPSLCEERYKGESAKLKLFSELVEELVSESHRVLVFSQFTSFLNLTARELNRVHIPHVLMTGETPVKHRQAIIKRFQNGEVPVFLVSLRAGGTGLNLTHANYVIHMDPWWNPAVEEQATDRAHRIGQTQAVTVYRLVASNTIEEAILAIHDRKKDLVRSLLEGKDTVGQLSISDLVSLIKGQVPDTI